MRRNVPFRVQSKFDDLRSRFGSILVRSFAIIKKKGLTDIKMYLSAAFQDTLNEVKDLESMEQLYGFLLNHTSFTNFPMLKGLANHFSLVEVEKELVSFTKHRSEMYAQILAEDYDGAGIDECIKDSHTKVCCA